MTKRIVIRYKNGNIEYATYTGSEDEINKKIDDKLAILNNPLKDMRIENRKRK